MLHALAGFGFGLLVATVTTPVGVSGAVFLLPIQLSVLHVPNPSVTPTNHLYNVVAAPGALLRFRRSGALGGPLVRLLATGTLPGVVIGSVIRVYFAAGPREFRMLAAGVLMPLGAWLLTRRNPRPGRRVLSSRTITAMALVVGVVGGIYGIGGGSILGPILVGNGMSVAVVAPAALASTWLASSVGAATYALLALTTAGSIAPDWVLGLACGLGGLCGGYLGARLQPRLPEKLLRVLLGAVAIALGITYLIQAI